MSEPEWRDDFPPEVVGQRLTSIKKDDGRNVLVFESGARVMCYANVFDYYSPGTEDEVVSEELRVEFCGVLKNGVLESFVNEKGRRFKRVAWLNEHGGAETSPRYVPGPNCKPIYMEVPR